MSNYKAITGSSKIVHRNQGGGSKLQGIPSSTNLNTWSHVAFRNRNVVCPCNRDIIFCMNQLGGVGAGGIPGRSYMFAPTADGTHKPFYCGHRFNYHLGNNKYLIHPKKYIDNYILLYSNPDIFYIQNDISVSHIISNKIELNTNKVYKLTISNIKVTVIFKVISIDPSQKYIINVIEQDNFPNGSTFSNINGNQVYYNNKTRQVYKTSGEINIYVEN